MKNPLKEKLAKAQELEKENIRLNNLVKDLKGEIKTLEFCQKGMKGEVYIVSKVLNFLGQECNSRNRIPESFIIAIADYLETALCLEEEEDNDTADFEKI